MAETGDHVGMRRGSVTRALAISWIAALSVVLLIAIATTIFGNPHAGDPVVRMSVSVGGERRAAGKPLNYVLIPGPTNSTPASAPAATPVEIAKPVYAGRALVADPSLIETTQAGPLPKVSRDGRTPMIAYAGAIPPASKRPRIAIIISGLGISAKQTEAALESLPPAVTFAFAPYADDVRHWVAAARGLGHEVLLQVPMEAYELPDHDPGPHTLRANQDSAANIQRLDWALGRFTGYVGVTNMEGGHFLADPEALAPVLQDLSKRGLLFFDDGEALHSVSAAAAEKAGIAFAQSTLRLDPAQSPKDIDAQIAQLEKLARLRRAVSGTAVLTPLVVERIQLWAANLDSRGFEIVPTSAIVSQPKTE